MSESERQTVIDIQNIVLGYSATAVVHDITLSINRGELHAFVGENGAGKTTLIKAIGGLIPTLAGSINISSTPVGQSANIGMVLQHDVLPMNMTVNDCIRCALISTKIRFKSKTFETHLARVGLSVVPSTKVSALSMHQRQLLQLACVLAMNPEIILLDEPTAVMSHNDSQNFWHLIRNEVNTGRTVVVATHKIEDVLSFCSDVTVMCSGKHVFTRQVSSVTMQQLISGMSSGSVADADMYAFAHDPPRTEVCVQIASDVSEMKIHNREIHGIAGLDGSGYETWLHALALNKQKGKTVHVNSASIDSLSVAQRRRAGIGYIPDDRHSEGLIGTEPLTVNMSFGQLPVNSIDLWKPVNNKMANHDTEAIVEEYDVRPRDVGRCIDSLSGGNQQKFLIGRELERKNTIVVMNQPTRGLDRTTTSVISKRIRNASAASSKTFLIYSDDLSFLMCTCDVISTVVSGEITASRPVTEWTEMALVEAIV